MESRIQSPEQAQNGQGKPPRKNGQHFPSFSELTSTKWPGEATAKKRAAFPLFVRSNSQAQNGPGKPPQKTGSISPLFPVKLASTKWPGETAAKKRAAFPPTQYINGWSR
jgi:hypothetical protein